jgi:hypothetical protein
VVTGEEIGVGVFSEYLKIEAGQNRGWFKQYKSAYALYKLLIE